MSNNRSNKRNKRQKNENGYISIKCFNNSEKLYHKETDIIFREQEYKGLLKNLKEDKNIIPLNTEMIDELSDITNYLSSLVIV